MRLKKFHFCKKSLKDVAKTTRIYNYQTFVIRKNNFCKFLCFKQLRRPTHPLYQYSLILKRRNFWHVCNMKLHLNTFFRKSSRSQNDVLGNLFFFAGINFGRWHKDVFPVVFATFCHFAKNPQKCEGFFPYESN